MVRRLASDRLFLKGQAVRSVGDQFHRLYYDAGGLGRTWASTRWLGIPTQKCPFDLWIYQEILFELKPDVIIECGTADGGSALFLASLCDLLGKGRVVTVDIKENPARPKHPRITYLLGSSTAERIVDQIRQSIHEGDTVMAVLDSDHRKEHVVNELRIYSRLVTVGSYLIVEDTNLNGHPVAPSFGPGPLEAVHEFLERNGDFVVDRTREKFLLTFNPGGYLRRIR